MSMETQSSSQLPQYTPGKHAPLFQILIGIFLLLVIGFLGYRNWQLKQLLVGCPQKAEPNNQLPVVTPVCPLLEIPGYELATDRFSGDSASDSAIFQIDLRGNGQQEEVRLYHEKKTAENFGAISKPVILRVFTGSGSCFQEEFSYDGKVGATDRSGNELGGGTAFYPNFWGENQNALFFELISTGYGSGYKAYLDFLTYQPETQKYIVVEGPEVDELSLYKFIGVEFPGRQILIAKAVWEQGEAHFAPHRFRFISYDWDGHSYSEKTLGTTVNKYGYDYDVGAANQDLIDTILQKEPNVLKPNG